jgi:hypothetical protein
MHRMLGNLAEEYSGACADAEVQGIPGRASTAEELRAWLTKF